MRTRLKFIEIQSILPWFSLVLVVVISWWLRVRYLWTQPLDYDEGHWLMFGVLTNAGHTAYSDTFVGIPPLALLVIQLGASLFNTTLAVRYPMMAVGLIGVAAMFIFFRPWQSWIALLTALLAAFLLSFNYLYFRNSASIMAEVSSVAIAVLSLALAQQYYFEQRLFWLGLSGFAFALSLALKVFVIFIPALVGIFILPVLKNNWLHTEPLLRHVLIAGAVWLAGFLLPILLFVIVYEPVAMLQQVFLFRMALRQVWGQSISPLDNVAQVGQMWLDLWPLAIGAAIGVIIGRRRARLDVLMWLAWAGLATLLLIWHIPLRDRYAVMLVPPLAALSAIGLTALVIDSFKLKLMSPKWVSGVAATVLVVGVIGWTLAAPVKSANLQPSPDTFPDLNLNAVQYVWKHTLPQDCLITDDQRFAFAAGRLVPAALSETSWARIITRWVTVDDIANQAIAHNCPMVVYAARRFNFQLPELAGRLRQLYNLEIIFEDGVTIYTGNKQVTKTPQSEFNVQLGQAVIFNGVDIDPPGLSWKPGQEIRLATYWTVLQSTSTGHKIFLQLRNEEGDTIASFDHFPFPTPAGKPKIAPTINSFQNFPPEEIARYPARGMLPTFAWTVGQTIREVAPISLPPDLPPEKYRLYLGMYNPDTLTRLEIAGQTDDNSILVGTFEVTN